ncbi:MAG: 1-acylglycerol-3-phosphate O-acyltransferase [Hydrogenophaga sp.]|uniref:1-acylglycerol-3-phosphate O-acyltransferase n=1 Tax=Hydrogenophaga sp. TaxID=1904254 RepID=UPI0027307193|nr:1-acylglycerol-3-phosphate O-acyltransferase [Hydrogenophaga sp.]MDP2164266.1 1-acylglycerol-3-phosphate O-acyltransferase [Hydrogenophaga sp.]MDP3477488.1 1-acylglycerol-3-phosphate O-acyltransferase [Hydrogenophaga sp.]
MVTESTSPAHPTQAPGEGAPATQDDTAQRLLSAVAAVAAELRQSPSRTPALGLDDSLERDWGLDSLARVELITRVGQVFGVQLDENALSLAETPRDLLRLVHQAPPAAMTDRVASAPRSAARPETSATPPGEAPAATPDTATTLLEVFDWHLQQHPDQVLITLYESGDESAELSYATLHADAQAVAAGLQARGLARGDAVAIMLPTGREFFAAFFGILRAGGVPVPVYPPARPSQLEDHLRRIAGILRNSKARELLTVERAKPLAHLLRAEVPSLQAVATVADVALPGSVPTTHHISASDVAFLQYTSGSTGEPKGVVLTHANLLANLRAMWRASGTNARDTFVSWLPLYHDMGLIGACLGALVVGFHLVLMSPLAFLARPLRWLEMIERHRGTVSAAPNFAYELCLAKVSDAEVERLDLSSWRLAFNGAEPVSPETLERFAQRFGRCGLKSAALTPVYGLAESSVGLAFPPLGRGPWIERVDRIALAHEGVARPARDGDPAALRIVSCGLPLPGHEIRVVDASGRELPERQQGRVQFRGPSSTQGYLANPQANARLFDGDWLNTGDLGFALRGELFLTGREKDIVIRGGFNIHPHELESAVAALPGIRKGGVAVFPASDPRHATERLVVLAETRTTDAAQRAQLVREIMALSATLLGAPADDVVLAPPHSVLKTSSGKIRRAACRELYEQGRLGTTQRAPWRQWLSLAASAALSRARFAWQTLARRAWGLWAWAVLLALGSVAWCLIMLGPQLEQRRSTARAFSRAVLRLIGLPVQVQGLEHLPTDEPCLVVANHASYLDSLLLGALLPPRFAFVAKRELETAPFVGAALRRLGVAFVERFDAARGIEDAQSMLARVRAGESFVVFPEGTFRRAPGLLPFKLGAFVTAADAGVPLVPAALQGTRSLLRAGAWLPERGPVGLRLLAPVRPSATGWDAALAARDEVRAALAAELREPVLDHPQ